MGTKLSKIRHIILSATKGPHRTRKEHTYTRRRKRTRTGRKMKEENTKRTTRTQTRTAPEDDTILDVSEHLNNMRIRQTAARAAALKAIDMGMAKVEVVINGRGNGRETSIRALKNAGLNIISIEDKTSIPHNGCRPPKKRRL